MRDLGAANVNKLFSHDEAPWCEKVWRLFFFLTLHGWCDDDYDDGDGDDNNDDDAEDDHNNVVDDDDDRNVKDDVDNNADDDDVDDNDDDDDDDDGNDGNPKLSQWPWRFYLVSIRKLIQKLLHQ